MTTLTPRPPRSGHLPGTITSGKPGVRLLPGTVCDVPVRARRSLTAKPETYDHN